MSGNTLDLKSTPSPQVIIGVRAPLFNVGQYQYRSSRNIQDYNAGQGDYPDGHGAAV